MKITFGIQKGEVVAMDCMNSEMFIWIWLGLWSIGAKPAFINYNLTDRPLVHSIKTSTARVALVDEQVKSKYTEEILNQFADASFREGKGFCEVVFMDPVLRKGIDELQPMRFPDSDRSGQLLKDMAILIYTVRGILFDLKMVHNAKSQIVWNNGATKTCRGELGKSWPSCSICGRVVAVKAQRRNVHSKR